MSTTLSELVREQILAEGPDLPSEREDWTHPQYEERCEQYVDDTLNAMSNVQLLERISNALQKAATAMPVSPHL